MPSPLTSPDIDFFKGIPETVARALAEDIGTGDITAELIEPGEQANARIICRDQAVICGAPWVNEVLSQVDSGLKVKWHCNEGDLCKPDDTIIELKGSARSLLTAERCALNFLQTLSATATTTRKYTQLTAHTKTEILDTRKTRPGLRLAQKYAVLTGGGTNHRIGLFDAFLIKENHIAAAGSITDAISRARTLHPERPVEVEIETLSQLKEALLCKPDVVMLDNFSNDLLVEAVNLNKGQTRLEASGNYDEHTLVKAAETGVDFISIGALTKHVTAVDFSMRILI